MEETERQVADLEEAIANLEATIRKIDAETRELLRTTFTEVNKNFREMFTGLFGGGSAELRMSGEEILEAGVEVSAQPPGKKNASVKLLSGGEQAMTATALVFAIFKLNPAPFCLLDEVDAPLDEANQDRLARRILPDEQQHAVHDDYASPSHDGAFANPGRRYHERARRFSCRISGCGAGLRDGSPIKRSLALQFPIVQTLTESGACLILNPCT